MVVGGPQTLVSTLLVVLLVEVSMLDTVLMLMALMVLLVVVAVPDMAPVSKVDAPEVVVSNVVSEGTTPPGREGEVDGMTDRLGGG